MNHAPPIIAPILATPFGVISLPQAASVNPALHDLATRQAAVGPASGSNSLYQRSSDDLFEWREPSVHVLRDAMLQGVYSIVGAVNELSETQLRALSLETRAWINILYTDGNLPAASYPLSAWCAIYCVAAPPMSDARADSGVLRLYESRLGTMFQDASNSSLRFPFKAAHYSWRPMPGEMAVFPASLLHEIALLRAPGKLVWVTARIRFVAAGQQGVGRW
jgi:hypothetical protein